MPVTAIVILIGFLYLVSTAAALLLSLMAVEDVKRRFIFVPVLNSLWFAWSLFHMFAPGRAAASGKPRPEAEMLRRDGYLANFSTFRPPWLRP